VATYYDTSALVKLVILETESAAMHSYWTTHSEPASSALARTELFRAIKDEEAAAKRQARTLLASLDLVVLDDQLLDVAGSLDQNTLKPLDAIHIASALSLGDSLDKLVTYDKRMIEAAHNLGLSTVSPS
jgi:predicted nucleic acid-binding protein